VAVAEGAEEPLIRVVSFFFGGFFLGGMIEKGIVKLLRG
jgi:hypothetical protein